MDDLPFDWDVLVFFNFAFLGNVFDLFFWDVLGDVLTKILDSVVIGDGYFPRNFFDPNFFSVLGHFSSLGNSFYSSFVLVFDHLFLEWHVLNSALPLNNFLPSVHHSVHNLGLLSNCCACGIAAGVGGGSNWLLIGGSVCGGHGLLVGGVGGGGGLDILGGGVGGGGRLDILGGVGRGGGRLGILGGGGLISSVAGSAGPNLVFLGDACGDSSQWVAGNSVNLNFPACHRVEYQLFQMDKFARYIQQLAIKFILQPHLPLFHPSSPPSLHFLPFPSIAPCLTFLLALRGSLFQLPSGCD